MVKNSIAMVVLFCAFTLCQAAESQVGIAKVDMRELEPLLLEVAFAKPENQEVRDKYVALQEHERALRAGEIGVEEAVRSFAFGRMELNDAVEDLAKGELIVLIEDMFGDRYQLIVNDGYGGGVLYTQAAIPDITPNIRQRLLKNRLAGQVEGPMLDKPVDEGE